VPPTLKPIAHYIKIANENANRDPVVYYWCLFHAVQSGMQIDKKSPEALTFLTSLLSTLETIKKQLAGNDAITSEVVGQAHIENFAMKLFDYADKKEKAGQIDKSVVHAFYTAGHVMDILSLFGEIDEPYASAKKYAKWKSTQIFACLRDGTPYTPSSQEPLDSIPGGSGMAHEHKYEDTNPFNEHQSTYQPPHQNHEFGLPTVPTHTNRPQPSVPAPLPQPSSTESFGSSSAPRSSNSVPSFDEWETTRKFAKYAISSIDYEDVKATVDSLRQALAVVEKYV
jgi:vacuolar protein sorting-associated protein VTA1